MEEIGDSDKQPTTPFNGAIEVGLRALILLTEAYAEAWSLQRLVVFDYLLVHSDDLPGGPPGLHPQTPHRGGELLVRRDALQRGLALYESRGLVAEVFDEHGIRYSATEHSAAFIASFYDVAYVDRLKERAAWLVHEIANTTDSALDHLVSANIGRWGAEFSVASALWAEDE